MYKRIMVAIDENFATGKVLSTAVELTRLFQSQLLICYALDETIFAQKRGAVMLSHSVGEVEQALRSGAQEFLDKAVDMGHAAGVEAETRIVESEVKSVPEMLAEAASAWNADLLVAGTHGHRGVERFFVGSVGEKLVRTLRTSLLLVRND